MKTIKLQTLTFILVTQVMMVLGFQNCSKVSFNSSLPLPRSAQGVHSSEAPQIGHPKIIINNGAEFTNDVSVQLTLEADKAIEMYLSNEADCTAGQWEPMETARLWSLAQANGVAYVYGKFRNAGLETKCVEASIIHDRNPPVVSYENGPDEFTTESNADFIVRATDTLSGIARIECRLGPDKFHPCSNGFGFSMLQDGSHKVFVRAIDKAGNSSQPIEYPWLIDVTKPVVQIIDPKPPITDTKKASATFLFEARDPSGSGILNIICKWDDGAPTDNCTSPSAMTDLAQGQHTFQVWAIDRAGNISDPATYSWLVDTVPSGDFEILGVTGGADDTKDAFLGTAMTPTIHWTQSTGAMSYQIAVLNDDDGKTMKCPLQNTTNLTYAYDPAVCTLDHAVSYWASAVAFDNVNLEKPAPPFKFTVDFEPPAIAVQQPVVSDDRKSVTIDGCMATDDVSGVGDVACYRTSGAVKQQVLPCTCDGQTTITLTDLIPGDHSFEVVARDVAGNESKNVVNFNNSPIICDPFDPNHNGECRKGIKGKIYYQTQDQLQYDPKSKTWIGWGDVNTYIEMGTQANAILYLSQLLVTTRLFDTGFPTSDGSVLKTNEGANLFEWFALDLESILKLGPTDAPGRFQFAVVSDDGSIVSIKDPGAAEYRTLIDSNGTHATHMECADETLTLDATTRIPIRVKYFQGPRFRISLNLLYRPAPADHAADPLCGTTSDKEFFGADGTDPATANYDGTKYGELLSRGWKPLSMDNFMLDEAQ